MRFGSIGCGNMGGAIARAVSGCGPAFAGMLLGTAQPVLESGRHPAELKDAV